MKWFRFIAHVFLWIIVSLTAIILLGSSILLFYQDQVISIIKSELNHQYQLNINYDWVSVNTLRSFPHFSYYFENFSVSFIKNQKVGTIIMADEIGISIQPFNLLMNRISIESFMAKNAIVNLNQKFLNSLISSEKSNTEQMLSVSSFLLNDYEISYADSLDSEVFYAKGSKMIVRAKYSRDQITLKSNLALEHFRTKSFILKNPIKLQVETSKNNDQIFYSYEIYIKSIILNGIGKYNTNNSLSINRFKTKRFKLKDLLLLFGNKDLPEVIEGRSLMEGYIRFCKDFSYIDTLIIKHSTQMITIEYQKNKIQIPNLEGFTEFTHNLQQHFSVFQKFNISYSGLLAENMYFNIRGIDPIRILSRGNLKGEYSINNNKIKINFNGPFKVFAEILNHSSTNSELKIIKLSSNLNIASENNLFDNSTFFSGKLKIDNDFELSGTLTSKLSRLNIIINQPNILAVINKNVNASPLINIKGDYVDYDDILGLLSNEPQSKGKNATIEKAKLNLNIKTVVFRNHKFSNFRADGHIQGDSVRFSLFSADCFGGNISGQFLGINNTYKTTLWLSTLDINKVFLEFGDWGQSIITHQNISGKLKGLANLSFSINNNSDINLSSILLNSDIKIVNGKLIGMNKISKLSKWLNLNQIKVIEFDTLKNKIMIENNKIIIPSMDIKSNVILMNVSGVHTFSNFYEYTTRINVSNLLRKRFFVESENIPRNTSTDGSINLYLKLTGKAGSYQIDWLNRKTFELNQSIVSEITPDTLNVKKDSEKPKPETSTQQLDKIRIEWDEFNDTLKTE